MNYTNHTNTPTDELLALAFTQDDVDPLALELANRLVAALEESDDLAESYTDMDEHLAMIEDLQHENSQLASQLEHAEERLAELDN